MPSLTEYLPDLKRYLLEYPKVTLPASQSFLYWQNAKFGLKPTIRINHLTIVEQPTHVDVVSKMLYSTHYFWTAIELRVLIPDPARGPGFWFVNVNRSRSDGLSGFTGSIVRGKARGGAEKGMPPTPVGNGWKTTSLGLLSLNGVPKNPHTTGPLVVGVTVGAA